MQGRQFELSKILNMFFVSPTVAAGLAIIGGLGLLGTGVYIWIYIIRPWRIRRLVSRVRAEHEAREWNRSFQCQGLEPCGVWIGRLVRAYGILWRKVLIGMEALRINRDRTFTCILVCWENFGSRKSRSPLSWVLVVVAKIIFLFADFSGHYLLSMATQTTQVDQVDLWCSLPLSLHPKTQPSTS